MRLPRDGGRGTVAAVIGSGVGKAGVKGVNRRRAGTLLGVLGVAVLALGGCSPTAPLTSPGKPSGSLTIPTPATAAVGATTVPNPSDWPDQDTPIGQASVQLQMVWDPYGVTVIPSRHVFDAIPPVPTVLDKTNGALTQSQVQQMGLALYRTELSGAGLMPTTR